MASVSRRSAASNRLNLPGKLGDCAHEGQVSGSRREEDRITDGELDRLREFDNDRCASRQDPVAHVRDGLLFTSVFRVVKESVEHDGCADPDRDTETMRGGRFTVPSSRLSALRSVRARSMGVF